MLRNCSNYIAEYQRIITRIVRIDTHDYFLTCRFKEAARIIKRQPEIDGVYEPVGYGSEDELAELRWRKKNQDRESPGLTTMSYRSRPEKLFESQAPIRNLGYCPTNRWVVRKGLFEKMGLFNDTYTYMRTL